MRRPRWRRELRFRAAGAMKRDNEAAGAWKDVPATDGRLDAFSGVLGAADRHGMAAGLWFLVLQALSCLRALGWQVRAVEIPFCDHSWLSRVGCPAQEHGVDWQALDFIG